MSILIKGVEMPTSCHDCGISALVDVSDGLAYGCRVLKEMIFNNRERLPNCPLIELPKHGRLIDADALRHWILTEMASLDTEEDREFVADRLANELPTIIEADDSVKQVEWETHNDGIMYWWECSRCHHEAWYDKDYLPNYCPYCGAKMKDIEAEGDDGSN